MHLANLRFKIISDLAKDRIVELLRLESWDQMITSAIENHVDPVDYVYSLLSKNPRDVGELTLDTVRIICTSDCISAKEEYIDQLHDFVYHKCST